jgi:putative ABC transport system ATP-binding protein
VIRSATQCRLHLYLSALSSAKILLPVGIMIELFNISKIVASGDEKLTILHSLDLSIPDGQFVSIIGPSGSGKSTLLGLIAGLDAPSSGDIKIDGELIVAMNEDRLAELRGKKIGFIFQSFHLIPSLTALENILVPMEIAGLRNAAARAGELIKDIDLVARAHHYPAQLSGGEQQRIAVARAFANGPSILLADEPTGNLDTNNGRHVFDLMVDMNRKRGTTLVLVTHEHELADLADRRISLRDGRIVSDISARFADGATVRDAEVEATL